MSLTFLVYDAFIRVYGIAIRLAARFNPKARLWVQGRKQWRSRLEESLAGRQVDLWMHCASLGEFEQGRPMIEAVRQSFPGLTILVSFFSPSGYEVRKNYLLADVVCYLPLDTPGNAQAFLELTRPGLAVFVKYEFWMNYLTKLHKRDIPVLLISAIFRPQQIFFRPYGKAFLRLLTRYDQIFLQDDRSRTLLATHGITRTTLAGDTRFDRVRKIAGEARDIPGITDFLGGAESLVAGSTWPGDEEAIQLAIGSIPKWIIAPHEVNESRIRQLEKRFKGETVRYTALAASGASCHHRRILLIDNVGMLSSLYRYGVAALVGGGFDHGIHNVLEAAVYGIPVLFGPRHAKFREAIDLIERGAAFSLDGPEALPAKLQALADPAFRARCGQASARYVTEQSGAIGRIMAYIQEKRFFTS